MPIFRTVKYIVFDGIETEKTVIVSDHIPDAQQALWVLYDESNMIVEGSCLAIFMDSVRIETIPAPIAGTYSLVGIS